MMRDKILNKIRDVSAINYDTHFVNEQLIALEEIKRDNVISSGDENMHLTIICSALKYYLEMSPMGYSDDIINIIDRLEATYGVEGILESLTEEEFSNT